MGCSPDLHKQAVDRNNQAHDAMAAAIGKTIINVEIIQAPHPQRWQKCVITLADDSVLVIVSHSGHSAGSSLRVY